jgi:hypothetical protein
MFLTQVWGTVFGAFINYVVMISIVNQHRDLLLNSNGNYAWSGATFQSLNNQATTWALSADLYSSGSRYILVPVGLALGFVAVFLHRVIVHVSEMSIPEDWADPSISSSPTFAASICETSTCQPLPFTPDYWASSRPKHRLFLAPSSPAYSSSTISETTDLGSSESIPTW